MFWIPVYCFKILFPILSFLFPWILLRNFASVGWILRFSPFVRIHALLLNLESVPLNTSQKFCICWLDIAFFPLCKDPCFVIKFRISLKYTLEIFVLCYFENSIFHNRVRPHQFELIGSEPLSKCISQNYRSATENMFREVLKWTSCVFLGSTTLFWNVFLY
jgi:hypothetical protein